VQSARRLFLSSWINVLLIAVPLSFASHFAGWGSTAGASYRQHRADSADFIISFCAIIPLAGLLGDATEQIAMRLGQALGGLLNATCPSRFV